MTSNPTWPAKAMVGYVDTSASGSMDAITADQATAYNVIIFGFVDEDGSFGNNLITGINFIQDIQAQNTLNLVSVGGASGSFDWSDASMTNLIDGVQKYGLDGIDFDIEDASTNIATMQSYIEDLKDQVGETCLITCAPILAGTSDQPTLNIPNGGDSLEPIYSSFAFDAILVQAYNSGTNFSYPNPCDASQTVNETSANIIAAAYDDLDKNGNIIAGTPIVIGIPANPGAAATASNCWNDTSLSDTTALILANTSDIYSNQCGMDSSRFGGLMTWSLNCDADPSAYPPETGATANGNAGYFAANVAIPFSAS